MTVLTINASTFTGLSTDTKPTVGIIDGSVFFEIDTNNIYTYNKTYWIETGSGWNDESRLPDHIKNNKFLGAGPGNNTITVGGNGHYTTLQAAVNAALLLPQFTAVQALIGASTLTLTQNSKVVTGSGTLFSYDGYNGLDAITNGQRYVSVTTGAAKKWYPVECVVSDTELRLAIPFREATTTTAAGQWWGGHPNITTIDVLDIIESETTIYVTATGLAGGAEVVEVALRFKFSASNYDKLTFRKRKKYVIRSVNDAVINVDSTRAILARIKPIRYKR